MHVPPEIFNSMELKNVSVLDLFDDLEKFAECNSGCKKVQVAAGIYHIDTFYNACMTGLDVSAKHPLVRILQRAANETRPDFYCMAGGCNRVRLYGEDSKNHRLPSDCLAIHSEVHALLLWGRKPKTAILPRSLVMLCTRYPCEACARAIAVSGIEFVVYGRDQEISPMTKDIFDDVGVKAIHCKEWDGWKGDTTR